MNKVKTFKDGSFVYYDRGNFDDYCVNLKRNNQSVFAPRDYVYFQFFIDKAKVYGADKIYNDFCLIYNLTSDSVSNTILEKITTLSQSYNTEDQLDFDIWFTVIYMGMVAEEKKERAILKKKIKRLGFHQIMFDGFTANQAANFSRGKNFRDLLAECQKRGF